MVYSPTKQIRDEYKAEIATYFPKKSSVVQFPSKKIILSKLKSNQFTYGFFKNILPGFSDKIAVYANKQFSKKEFLDQFALTRTTWLPSKVVCKVCVDLMGSLLSSKK